MKKTDVPANPDTIFRLRRDLRRVADPVRAEHAKRFFKTGKGEYGEGDMFIGATVPSLRVLSRRYADVTLTDLLVLLASPIHEERLLALIILTQQYAKGTAQTRAAIYRMYLAQRRYINNWDLVDVSAHKIIGEHVQRGRSRAVLDRLIRSRRMWDRRIAIISTFRFLKEGDVNETLRLVTLVLRDTHDLMHKAAGWALREVGKRDQNALYRFLDRHAGRMPRTMLRYAIERLPERERQRYLAHGRS